MHEGDCFLKMLMCRMNMNTSVADVPSVRAIAMLTANVARKPSPQYLENIAIAWSLNQNKAIIEPEHNFFKIYTGKSQLEGTQRAASANYRSFSKSVKKNHTQSMNKTKSNRTRRKTKTTTGYNSHDPSAYHPSHDDAATAREQTWRPRPVNNINCRIKKDMVACGKHWVSYSCAQK